MPIFEGSPAEHIQDEGPFDIIGDVHGCREELEELLGELGYEGVETCASKSADSQAPCHPQNRRAVFVGDLTDRGPDSIGTVRLIAAMCNAGTALVAPGNHDGKLLRYLRGRPVHLTHGAETTAAEIDALSSDEQSRFRALFEDLMGLAAPYLILDHGNLVVAHAGIRADMIGDDSGRTVQFVLLGDTNGMVTSDGYPVRRDWAKQYRGKSLVVYGHTPVRAAIVRNNTINIDTGCVFGGSLTAIRYPERELVQVASKGVYWGPARWATHAD